MLLSLRIPKGIRAPLIVHTTRKPQQCRQGGKRGRPTHTHARTRTPTHPRRPPAHLHANTNARAHVRTHTRARNTHAPPPTHPPTRAHARTYTHRLARGLPTDCWRSTRTWSSRHATPRLSQCSCMCRVGSGFSQCFDTRVLCLLFLKALNSFVSSVLFLDLSCAWARACRDRAHHAHISLYVFRLRVRAPGLAGPSFTSADSCTR